MALNRKGFRTRAITAIIFAAVMIAGLFFGPLPFAVLFSIIHFGCWWEYFGLIEKIQRTTIHMYVKIGLMVIGYPLMLWLSAWSDKLNNFSLIEEYALPVSAAGFAILIIGIFQKLQLSARTFFMLLAGLLYISVCWGLMLNLYFVYGIRDADVYSQPVLLIETVPIIIVFTIWINDTMAYIVGSFIGKTPLSSISPKKTWEGTIGGVVLAVMINYLLVVYVFRISYAASWYHWIIIAGIISIMGTVGDLLESKLKRLAGVKDSGSFMPGHGGFLDRFDSLLLAVPCVWVYLKIFYTLNS